MEGGYNGDGKWEGIGCEGTEGKEGWVGRGRDWMHKEWYNLRHLIVHYTKHCMEGLDAHSPNPKAHLNSV